MRVKICGIQNEQEMYTAIEAGADAIGFQVGQLYAGRYFILPSTAERLTGELPPFVTPVLVTHLTAAAEIAELMERSCIWEVQLFQPPLAEVWKLRNLLPRQAKIIITEYVRYPLIDFDLSEYFPIVDAVNLDCYNQEPAALAQPQTPKHFQWDGAALFLKESPVPVILSGHLSADNVADAINQVRPFGVDACTELKNPADGFCDPARVRAFIQQARRARELTPSLPGLQ